VLEIPYIVQPAPFPSVAAPILAALAPLVDPQPILSGIAPISLFIDAPAIAATMPKRHATKRDIAGGHRYRTSVLFATASSAPPPGTSVRTWPPPAPQARNAAHVKSAGATHKLPKPGTPWHRPPLVPPGSEHDLSTGAAASGSSSSLGGFALLLAALLVIVPPALPTLLAVGANRPRSYAGRPPERPG
jgi:hypothetical protein